MRGSMLNWLGKSVGFVGMAVILAAAAAGCQGAATPVPPESVPAALADDEAPVAVGPDTEVASEADVASPSLRLCDEVRTHLVSAMAAGKAQLLVGPAAWADFVDGTGHDGCELVFAGLGADLGVGPNSYLQPAQVIRDALEGMGWEQDLGYAADAPGGSVFGYRGEVGLCVVNVSFGPPAGTTCPESDPIACGLPPAEHFYAIRVNCAEPPVD